TPPPQAVQASARPATRPADALGVQLTLRTPDATVDRPQGVTGKVGSNADGRFAYGGDNADFTKDRSHFASNDAGRFTPPRPDGAATLAGGSAGQSHGEGLASLDTNRVYTEGDDRPLGPSSPASDPLVTIRGATVTHEDALRHRTGSLGYFGDRAASRPAALSGSEPTVAASRPATLNGSEPAVPANQPRLAEVTPSGRRVASPPADTDEIKGPLSPREEPQSPAPVVGGGPGPQIPWHVLADGLIVHCPADGEANDDARNHHGTLHGGVDYAPGRIGQAWRFNGKDGRIALANPTEADKDAFTISAWVKVAAPGAHQIVLSKWYHDGQEVRSYCLGITPAMRPEAAMGPNGGGVAYLTSPDAVTADTWQHLALTWNGKEARLYLDGASKGSLAIPGGLRGSPTPWSVGAHDGTPAGPFHGLIDELSIWNRALSEEEVRALQTARPFAKNPLAEGLVGLWAGDGNADDSAGTSRGTVRGKVTFVPGKVGQAFQLSGKDGYVDLGNTPALQLTGNMTTAMWVNPSRLDDLCCLLVRTQNRDTIQMTADGGLHYCYGRNGDPRWEHIDLGSDGKALHYIESNPPVVLRAQKPGRVLRVGQWTHVALVRDLEGHALRWYFDGELVAEGPAAIPAPSITGAPLGLGFSPQAPGAGFSGLVDEVALWNRALSAEEVQAAFEARSLLEAFAGPVVITRETQADRVVLDDASVLKGTILNEAYEITTSLGKLTVPAGRIAGLASAAGSRTWLMLADRQRLLGPLADPTVRIKLSVGTTLNIPLARIRQAGYRLPAQPAEPSQLPLIVLRDGQRVLASEIKPGLTLRTDCGEVALVPRTVRSLEPAPAPAGNHRAVFANGSTLTGRLGPEKITLTLQLGPQAAVEREKLHGLLSPAGPTQPAPEAAILLLRNGDKLTGRADDAKLTVALEFGAVPFPPGCARALTFAQAPGAGVSVELWDGSRLTGSLAEPAVTFTVADGGPTVKVPTAQIAAIARAIPMPPQDVIDKIEGLIRQLGSATAADREAATAWAKASCPSSAATRGIRTWRSPSAFGSS
ncbi:MAG: LamG domain-containing protein, partial [Planctomycetota bacterium]|nr:LamG domain-containing protein [Planctomycetota bacterium]